MNFSEALQFIREGRWLQRRGWNGKGMFVFLVPGSVFEVNRAPLLGVFPEHTRVQYQPHIDMLTADRTVVPWLASQSDLLADDWQLVVSQHG
jgi:hypothetical protein